MKGPDLSVLRHQAQRRRQRQCSRSAPGPTLIEDTPTICRSALRHEQRRAGARSLRALRRRSVDEYAEVEVRLAGAEAMALHELPSESLCQTEPRHQARHDAGRGRASGFGTCIKSRDKSGVNETIQYEIDDADQDDELKALRLSDVLCGIRIPRATSWSASASASNIRESLRVYQRGRRVPPPGPNEGAAAAARASLWRKLMRPLVRS